MPASPIALPGPLAREREGEVGVVVGGVQRDGLGELAPGRSDRTGEEERPAQGLADRSLLGLEQLSPTEHQGRLVGVAVVEQHTSPQVQVVGGPARFAAAIQRQVLRISPFVGLLFDPAVVGPPDLVTTPPYDVVDEVARRRYQSLSPFNVVHLDLAEGDDGGGKYRRAAELLEAWRAAGALVPYAESGYFAYQMRFRLEGQHRRVRGILCALELQEWGGAIVPHERTMPGPIEDRLGLMRATRCNLSPVYGTIAGPCRQLGDLLDQITERPPERSATDEEGVEHGMWPLRADIGVERWLGEETLLIADGHHRYSTSLRYRNEMRAEVGPGPWDQVLTLVVDAGLEDPPVLPFHRIVLEDNLASAGARVRDLREVLSEIDDDALIYGTVSRDGDAIVHRVARLAGRPPTVSALHRQVIDPAIGLEALRFTPDAAEAEAAVRSGNAVGAYLLPPTTAERIRAVVDAGERLPPKSTFFWPKPRTGMVIRPLD